MINDPWGIRTPAQLAAYMWCCQESLFCMVTAGVPWPVFRTPAKAIKGHSLARTRRDTFRTMIAACAAAVVLGCDPTPKVGSPILLDSAGALWIEYATTFDAVSGRNWSTAPESLFSIGGAGSELYRVRMARFQSDGGVVIANKGSHELLLFDHQGQLRSRTGGEGGGPGEFRDLTFLSVGPDDSLFAYDARERRLSVFDPNGVFARTISLQGSDTLGRAAQIGVLSTGEIVGAFYRRTRGVGLVRDSLLVAMFTPSGQMALPLGMFPHFYTDWGPHPAPGHGGMTPFPLPVPFSSVTAVSLGDVSVYVGLPDRHQLIRLNRNDRRRVTRQHQATRPVTEAHRERLFAVLAESGMRKEELEILMDLEAPGTLPGFGYEPLTDGFDEELLVTDVGGVWLRPFQHPD